MPAFLVGQIRVHDQVKWSEYVAGVAKSLEPLGADAEIVMRGSKLSTLAGTPLVAPTGAPLDTVVVLKFKDVATLETWFHSELYQAIIPLRDSAASVTISSYEASL